MFLHVYVCIYSGHGYTTVVAGRDGTLGPCELDKMLYTTHPGRAREDGILRSAETGILQLFYSVLKKNIKETLIFSNLIVDEQINCAIMCPNVILIAWLEVELAYFDAVV